MILVVTTVHWASITKLCLALTEAGHQVMLIAPEGHALHGCAKITSRRQGRTRADAVTLLSESIRSWRPFFIIPGDEGAIELVRTVYARSYRRQDSAAREIARLIERSVGDERAFQVASAKSRFIALARTLGLLVPDTRPIVSKNHFARMLNKAVLPFVLKLDGGWGGLDVRIVRSHGEIERNFAALHSSMGWWAAFKKSVRRLDIHPLASRLAYPRSLSMQDYIAGRPANRAVFCCQGQVLAGLSVEALETTGDTGPATVVRVIDHPAMTEAAKRMVAELRLSGFVGFDFMLEAATGRAFLLEMNLRPTQICHLALDTASDQIGALADVLRITLLPRMLPNFPGGTVALFPQENWRNPTSPYLATAFQDVPSQAPEILGAYRLPVAPEPLDWLTRLRAWQSTVRRTIKSEAIDVR